MSKPEQVLLLDPLSDLKFRGPYTDVVTTSLRLNNPSERRVFFKVKTTAPRRYCVRPNSGLIEPGETLTVSVMLQPFDYDPKKKTKHKFMVQSVFAPFGASDLEAVWRETKPEDLMDSKLRCVFEMPSDKEESSDSELNRSAPLLSSRLDNVCVDNSEMKKLMDQCRRLQAELCKLGQENQKLKDEGVRVRRSPDALQKWTKRGQDEKHNSVLSLLIVITAIVIGFLLGKLVL